MDSEIHVFSAVDSLIYIDMESFCILRSDTGRCFISVSYEVNKKKTKCSPSACLTTVGAFGNTVELAHPTSQGRETVFCSGWMMENLQLWFPFLNKH